jgi:hypothetical protein
MALRNDFENANDRGEYLKKIIDRILRRPPNSPH